MLVAPLELRRNYERLGLKISVEGNLRASRFLGVCALHVSVGTILPSGPLSAIASFGSSEGHSLSVGPFDRVSWVRTFMDAHPRSHAMRGVRTLFADASSKDCLLIDSPERAIA